MQLRKLTSHIMLAICVTAALLVAGLLVAVVAYLVKEGGTALQPSLFTTLPTGDPHAPGGMMHAWVGTAVLLTLASLVGVPLGILCGIYLSEYRGDRLLPDVVRFVADVLVGVPSIVAGVLGYELLVVPLGRYNAFAGAFALAVLMVPFVSRTTEEMLRLVPQTLREAALALGATQATTVLRVVLPTASGGVVTGLMLALARIAGETAPLLFTALGSRLLTLSPREPFPSLTVQIFTYATGPYEAQRQVAFAAMLSLVCALFLVQMLVRLATRRLVN